MNDLVTPKTIPENIQILLANDKMRIRGILKGKLPQEERKKRVSGIIIQSMKNIGIFYKTKLNYAYFFDGIQKKLYRIQDIEFKYLVNQYFGINASTDSYKYLIEELLSHIFKFGVDAKIYNFSHYDQGNNVLYIHNNSSKIVRITKDEIQEVENGYMGIIFESRSSFDEWNLVADEFDPSGLYTLPDLLKTLNFEKDSRISKDIYMWLLEYYIYALFFPNILNTRPILAFIGSKGSGKSFFLKLLLYIFYGKETSLSNLPSNDEEFKNSLMNNYLYFIDNLDDSVSKSKIDILCSVATGVGIKKRILYTDMGELNHKVNSFIAITSRTPKFNRVDLNERLLMFKLESLEKYTSETELFSKINRDYIMTNIVKKIQILLGNIGTYSFFETKFRLADFSNLLLNLNNGMKTPDEISEILNLFTREQEEFSLEEDPLIALLEKMVSENKNALVFTAQELHSRLKERSMITYPSGERIPYTISSPIALGKKIAEIKKGLSNRFHFRIENGGSNVKKYVFAGFKTE